MSLDYAADHLTAAVRSLAKSDAPLAVRLQTAWDEHVQMVWQKPCLSRDLLREFRDLWQRYTAPSDDRQSTKLRALTREQSLQAIDELVSLATSVLVAAARVLPATNDSRLSPTSTRCAIRRRPWAGSASLRFTLEAAQVVVPTSGYSVRVLSPSPPNHTPPRH